MTENILALLTPLKKIFFVLCLFAAPLFFVTYGLQKPFNVQFFVLALGGGGILFCFGLKTLLKREVSFSLSLPDILFICFACVCALSVVYNYFHSPYPNAVWGEAMRRGLLLFTSSAAGYFFAKGIKPCAGTDKNTRVPLLVYVWALLWLFYPIFKADGFFDFYAAALWAFGIYACVKYLKNFDAAEVAGLLLAVGAIASVYGLMQSAGIDIFWKIDISGEFGARAVSTFGNPNFLSSFLALLMPLSVYYFFVARKAEEKFYYFILILIYSAYMAVAQTRSSWLGAALGFAVLFAFADFRSLVLSQKKAAALLTVAALAVFFAWPQSAGDKNYSSAAAVRLAQTPKISVLKNLSLNAPQSAINQSYHQRLMMWTCAAKTAQKSPLLGGGWGSFQFNYALCQGGLIMQNSALAPFLTQANAAHNEFMEVLSQSGFLGLFAYIAFWISFIILFVKNLSRLNAGQKLFYAALAAGVVAMFADNMLNITMQTAVAGFMFWLTAGLLADVGAEKKIKNISLLSACAIFFICCVLSAGWIARQSTILASDIYSFAGGKAYVRKSYPLAALELRKSLELSKDKAETYYNLANTLIKSGENSAAQKVVKEALKYFPAYNEFAFLDASFEAENRNYPAAAQGLKNTLLLNPSHKQAARTFAALLIAYPQMQTEDNLALLSRLSAMTDADDLFLFSYTDILLAKSMDTQAAEIARNQVAKDNFASAWVERLVLLDKKLTVKDDAVLFKAQSLGKYKKLLQGAPASFPPFLEAEIKKAARQYPTDLNAQTLLAEFYFKTAQYALAREILEGLYPSHPQDLGLNFALASVWAAMGDREKEAFYLREILRFAPLNVQAEKRLQKINLDKSEKTSLQKPLN